MEVKSYKSVSKQLQFLMKIDTCVKKQIQKMIEESEVRNNTNTYAYMQEAVDAMFT